MKTSVDRRLLKLVATETLLQLGFERATEHALNILTEVFSFHLESLIKRAALFQREGGEGICRYMIEDAYWDEQYQIRELMKFMEQQMSQLGDRQGESPFHALKLLPKGVTLRSVCRSTGTPTLEEKKSTEIVEDTVEVQIDRFMEDFIERCTTERGVRHVVGYSFDCSVMVESTSCNGLVPYECTNSRPRETLCGVRDPMLAEQELFTEDFVEKYQISL